MFHRSFDHSMHRFRDIIPNRSQRSKLDHSDIENDLWSDSTPFIFYYGIGFTPKKIHDAINLGNTSLLLNNIDKYGKMGKKN